MLMPVVCFVGLSSLLGRSLGCFQCFVDVKDSLRLCWGHVLTQYGIRNVDSCFTTLDSVFNTNDAVIEAGRVGRGYDKQLKEIMEAEILPMVQEFDRKLNDDYVYKQRLQKAADNFIAAASTLPRVSGCIPPCGFQSEGAVYNCVTCQYNSCEFPLDCPVQVINVTESSRSQMRCIVPFNISGEVEVVWRFAEEDKTQQLDRFEEVTVGVDTLYSIPQTWLHHQGTYQCEMYSKERSVVRLYFYLSVTPRRRTGSTELQELFDRALLPGGRLLVRPPAAPSSVLPWLLLVCCSACLLLLGVSFWALYVSMDS